MKEDKKITRRHFLKLAALGAAGTTLALTSCKRKTIGKITQTITEKIPREASSCIYCNQCTPCPYGIDIPGIFNYFNTLNPDIHGAGLRRHYNAHIPRMRQADHCINCRQCIPHCPERIKIPGELRKIDKLIRDKTGENITNK